jgi:uncharacterized protein YbcI
MKSITKTKGQVEDIITKKVIQFYVETIGVGPHSARTYILEDMVIIRLKGKLLPIERKLLEGKRGIYLVKNIRQSLHEITTKQFAIIVSKISGYNVVSSHSDVSTKTGEIIEVFILDGNYEKGLPLTNSD